MQYFALLALPVLVAAAPTVKRAGGAGAPTPVVLPADCNIVHAYPSPNSTYFAPTSEYASTALYTYSLSPGATSPSGTNDTEAVQNCLETCYGYGNPGECTSIWSAHGANVDEYGTTVYAEFVCKLFGTAPTSSDLGSPDEGDEDAQAHALTIGCAPRSE